MSISIFQMLEAQGRALSVQRTRMNLTSSNLANVETTRTAEGGPYKRRTAVVGARGAVGRGAISSGLTHLLVVAFALFPKYIKPYFTAWLFPDGEPAEEKEPES